MKAIHLKTKNQHYVVSNMYFDLEAFEPQYFLTIYKLDNRVDPVVISVCMRRKTCQIHTICITGRNTEAIIKQNTDYACRKKIS